MFPDPSILSQGEHTVNHSKPYGGKKTWSPVVLSSTCSVLCSNPNDLQLTLFTESQDTTMLSWFGLSVFLLWLDCDTSFVHQLQAVFVFDQVWESPPIPEKSE